MISYKKLLIYLVQHHMKPIHLYYVISTKTLAKLRKNENVDVSTICKICAFLNCQPGDIMEYVPLP